MLNQRERKMSTMLAVWKLQKFSLTLFGKNFVKTMVLLNILFDDFFPVIEFLAFPHCTVKLVEIARLSRTI